MPQGNQFCRAGAALFPPSPGPTKLISLRRSKKVLSIGMEQCIIAIEKVNKSKFFLREEVALG